MPAIHGLYEAGWSLKIAYQPFVTGVSGGKERARGAGEYRNTCRYYSTCIYGTEVEGLLFILPVCQSGVCTMIAT